MCGDAAAADTWRDRVLVVDSERGAVPSPNRGVAKLFVCTLQCWAAASLLPQMPMDYVNMSRWQRCAGGLLCGILGTESSSGFAHVERR